MHAIRRPYIFSPSDLGFHFCKIKGWWHYLKIPSYLTFSVSTDPCLWKGSIMPPAEFFYHPSWHLSLKWSTLPNKTLLPSLFYAHHSWSRKCWWTNRFLYFLNQETKFSPYNWVLIFFLLSPDKTKKEIKSTTDSWPSL